MLVTGEEVASAMPCPYLCLDVRDRVLCAPLRAG